MRVAIVATIERRCFPRRYRLTKTDEFSSVFGFKRAIRGKLFMLHFQPQENAGDAARLGLVVGKKLIKSAVGRNLVKRLARERFRLRHPSLGAYDLVIRLIAKPLKSTRQEIVTELDTLMAKLQPRMMAHITGTAKK